VEKDAYSSDSFQRSSTGALIGEGVVIKGDLSAEEAVEIRGRIEGDTTAKQHDVRIVKGAHIKGNVFAQTIVVEGTVTGNLFGEKMIVLESSAQVQGKIFAPRVRLDDGCRYKGRVSMDAEAPLLAAEALNKVKVKNRS
jgi:cytoskeletal protein CcmA (bactofilin family)